MNNWLQLKKSDYLMIGIYVLGLAIAIAALKNDVGSIQSNISDMDQDLQIVKSRLWDIQRRLSQLEGRKMTGDIMWKYFRGSEAIQRAECATEQAIRETLEIVGEQSDQQIPLDEGTLKNSKVIKVKGKAGFISYGGGSGTGFPRVPYAKRWHENSANFQRGRKHRYLVDPMNQYGPTTYRRLLQQAMKATF